MQKSDHWGNDTPERSVTDRSGHSREGRRERETPGEISVQGQNGGREERNC